MPTIIEREKTSPLMQGALRSHILRERERRKQEAAEAEKDFERKAKEEEEKRKKIEEENSTLEDIKEQLVKLNEKLEGLQQDKHQLFWQFKKVLHEESRRKAKLREQSEMNAASHQYPQAMGIGSHMLGQGSHFQGHTQPSFGTQGGHAIAGQSTPHALKRPHSPSGPVMQMYARPSLPMHSSPQHKHDGGFPGRSAYMSPAHGSSHHGLQASTPGRAYTAYPTSRSSTPERPGSGHSIYQGKQDQSSYSDEPVRTRIRMMPQSLLNQQASSPFSGATHMRSNSPGRYAVKTEKDHMSFSPGASGSAHHKYSSPQSNSRQMYGKHP